MPQKADRAYKQHPQNTPWICAIKWKHYRNMGGNGGPQSKSLWINFRDSVSKSMLWNEKSACAAHPFNFDLACTQKPFLALDNRKARRSWIYLHYAVWLMALYSIIHIHSSPWGRSVKSTVQSFLDSHWVTFFLNLTKLLLWKAGASMAFLYHFYQPQYYKTLIFKAF